MARLGEARLGCQWHVFHYSQSFINIWQGKLRRGRAGHGSAWCGEVGRGSLWLTFILQSSLTYSRDGLVRHGGACHGEAGRGLVRHGKVVKGQWPLGLKPKRLFHFLAGNVTTCHVDFRFLAALSSNSG